MSCRRHSAGIEHEYGLDGMRRARRGIDREHAVVHAFRRVEEHDQTVGRVWRGRHEDQVVLPRRQEDRSAQVAERERAPFRSIYEHGERWSTANRVQHVETRRLGRRGTVAVATAGDHGEYHQGPRPHRSRSTTYTLRWADGTMMRSGMFTCSGRFTM